MNDVTAEIATVITGLAQATVAGADGGMLNLITSLGSSAAAIFVVIYFLGYLKSQDERVAAREKERDEQWASTVKSMFDHLEAVTADKGVIIRENTVAMQKFEHALDHLTQTAEQVLRSRTRQP